MNRTENDLRDALRELERRADEHGPPPVATLVAQVTEERPRRAAGSAHHRFPRWLPPLAAAAAVAGAAVTATVLSTGSHNSPAAGERTTVRNLPPTPSTRPPTTSARIKSVAPPSAATILDDAAAKLAAVRTWTTPGPQDFFYVRTTEATTWTSVSGQQAGSGRTAGGTKIWVPGCKDGQIVSTGESGSCTLNDVPHYLSDAPTTPGAWNTYLEHMAPGARAGGAQGKIIVQVLHQDLTAPKAAAALLRFTAGCPGLHTMAVRPVAGERLTGVTCSSMTAGSYGLAFDANTHRFVGFVGVTQAGSQAGPAEIIERTGTVSTIGRTP